MSLNTEKESRELVGNGFVNLEVIGEMLRLYTKINFPLSDKK